ncbi:MAG: M3 family oligoendopeptidase [Bacteroidetes bacterium]|nr:M3 family oligoendopeptidase [Bacteroidota bacterium]
MDVVSSQLANKLKRHFLFGDLSFDNWEGLEPWFKNLSERKISSVDELMKWLLDYSELDAVFDEEMAWRYIRSTCDTVNPDYEKAYDFFVTEIEPKAAPWFQQLNSKLDACAFRTELNPEVYAIFLRTIHNDIAIYREKNIPLFTEIEKLKQEYGKIAGDMMVTMEGKEITIQQTSNYFKNTDRTIRLEAFVKVWERRLADREVFDKLFDQLCVLRQEVATNSGYDNFRDYSFASLGRFDYTKEDCFRFHAAVEAEVVPFITEIETARKKNLWLSELRPYDLEVDLTGKPALKPFQNGEDFLDKTILCLSRVRPAYAEYISTMRAMGHFDLDSRKGKAPGGYNYSLSETGVPFIFMNSVGSQRDVITMVHEAGHAIHSFLENPLPLTSLKNPPSEVCELASMSMELISMEYWNVFYSNEEDLKRARREQLEKVLGTLPWVATVDEFQHWIYENKNHTAEERSNAWSRIMSKFESPVIDWKGFEVVQKYNWQKQLHIFEVPFYYIEYGMAQLGAIAVWRNYLLNPEKALDQYEAALKLGYTQPIGKIYEAAGIKFDFSQKYVHELVRFVKEQLELIKQ